ncbi:hypothetical protein NFI96_001137 [Prochilodus magdalenae]|nr:hypothetical protein NFI96_001137 [Prochilodus magdalenae]
MGKAESESGTGGGQNQAVSVNPADFTMSTYYWTLLLLLATCAGSLFAQSKPVKVGSTTVLPCNWKEIPSTQLASSSPHVEWLTVDGVVFERLGAEMFQGERYKGRADVPQHNLRQGNCSLVLKNVTLADAGVYESYLTVRRTKRSLGSKKLLLQRVELSVDGTSTGPLFGQCLSSGYLDNKLSSSKIPFQAHEEPVEQLLFNGVYKVTVYCTDQVSTVEEGDVREMDPNDLDKSQTAPGR